ncbi:hypothetical protein D4764_01G0000550 [Takifugu flavidus]|uniref:Uncharacterized protein n=1 Tax=Takifugu flavidus TaxID=433684 RepID=A0A5C6PPP0_9TELE|nr:hypothetical protein D4764_01G0000550 [Takifugu flavidus]
MTSTSGLAATARDSHLDNGGVEHGPFKLNVPYRPRNTIEALSEVGETSLTGSSTKRSQQTLTKRLGLPGPRSGFLPHLHSPPDEVVRDRMVLKLWTIMDNPSHPLHNTVDKLRSSFSSFSNRLLQPRCSKERYRKSFLPSAIKLYNSS